MKIYKGFEIENKDNRFLTTLKVAGSKLEDFKLIKIVGNSIKELKDRIDLHLLQVECNHLWGQWKNTIKQADILLNKVDKKEKRMQEMQASFEEKYGNNN